MAFSSVIAGSHVKCYINGVLLGYITGVSQWTVDTEYREARGIDSNTAVELVPGQFRVTGVFSIVRGRDTGGLEGAGMVASGQKMLLQKTMTIELVDRLTDQVIFKALGCQVTRQTWNSAPKQVVMGQFNWTGTTFSNEAQS